MLLTVLKHGGQWDFLALMFKVKAPTFERMMIAMLDIVSDFAYERYVVRMIDKYDIETLMDSSSQFQYYPFARYATDVTFQNANRPTGNMFEARPYYSAKHKLHGYKSESSVLPNGIAVHMSVHHPGNTSDLQIFRSNIGCTVKCCASVTMNM